MKAVFKREFFSSFNRLYGYISVAVLTLLSAILFIFYNLSYASEDITSMLSAMVVVSALVIPVIAIGVFPSAKKVNTDELYDIMPISTKDVVLGKYFAALATVMLPTLLLAVFPAIAGFFGEVDHCASYSALIGFLLFQAAWLSVCIFIAKVAKNQLRACIWCYCIGILWYFSSILSVLVPTTRIATLIGLIALIALIAVILYISTKKLYVSVAALAILGIALAISFICLRRAARSKPSSFPSFPR